MDEIIIDTVVFDYLIRNQQGISTIALNRIQKADAVYVTTASILELANHVRSGFIPLNDDFDIFYQTALQKLGLILLDTQWSALKFMSSFDYQTVNKKFSKIENGNVVSGFKKDLHKDPYDRLIIAHAITMNIPIVSPDTLFPFYVPMGLQVIW